MDNEDNRVVHIDVNNLWSGEYDKYFTDVNELQNNDKAKNYIFVLHIDGFSIYVGRLYKILSNSAENILDYDLTMFDRTTYIRENEYEDLMYGEGFRKVRELDFVSNLSEQERKRRYNNMLYGIYTLKHYVYHKVLGTMAGRKLSRKGQHMFDMLKDNMVSNVQLLTNSMMDYKPYCR